MRIITGFAVATLLALSACRGQSAVLTRDQSLLKAAAEYVLQWERSWRCFESTGESDALKAANEWTDILKAENEVTELEAKTLPAEVRDRKLRASFELRTIKAPPGVTQADLELLKSYVNMYGSEWALHEFHFRTGDNAAKDPMLKARQELDEAIENLAEPWVRVQIAQNRQIAQDELQTEAKNQVLDELALTRDLQRARDGVEIATNAVLIRKLNTQLRLIKIVIQKADLSAFLDSRTAVEGQIKAARSKDPASAKAERHAVEVKKAAETLELRGSRQALAVALQNAANSR